MKVELKAGLLALSLTLGLSHCASVSEPTKSNVAGAEKAAATDEKVASTDNPEGIICKREKVVGSNIKKKVCTSAAQREKAKQRAAEISRKVGNSSVHTNMDGG